MTARCLLPVGCRPAGARAQGPRWTLVKRCEEKKHTLVHFVWVWRLVVRPDGYIPATVQEALLHVFLGEVAASELVRAVVAFPCADAVAGVPAHRPYPPVPCRAS